MEEFPDDFLSVTKHQLVQVLEIARNKSSRHELPRDGSVVCDILFRGTGQRPGEMRRILVLLQKTN